MRWHHFFFTRTVCSWVSNVISFTAKVELSIACRCWLPCWLTKLATLSGQHGDVTTDHICRLKLVSAVELKVCVIYRWMGMQPLVHNRCSSAVNRCGIRQWPDLALVWWISGWLGNLQQKVGYLSIVQSSSAVRCSVCSCFISLVVSSAYIFICEVKLVNHRWY